MDIEHKDVPELLKLFKTFWEPHYHIKFKWQPTWVQNGDDKTNQELVTLINVKVNDTDKGGEGEENWTLEYANTILKSAKEMDLCVKRWKDGFAKAKKESTLDILGHKGVTLN